MATNRIDILDAALLRPGRIDRKIEFPNPNESSRLDILKIHSRKMNLVRGIDLRSVADKMTGASGAELKVIVIVFWTCPFLSGQKNIVVSSRLPVPRLFMARTAGLTPSNLHNR